MRFKAAAGHVQPPSSCDRSAKDSDAQQHTIHLCDTNLLGMQHVGIMLPNNTP
jgi:hypothetical protein